MRRMKMISLFVVVLALIPLFSLIYRVGGQIYRNQQKINRFSYNNQMEQYERRIPMDNMDLHEYSVYFQIPQTLEGIRVSNVIELPREIQYFTEQDGKKILTMEISKGKSILWLPSEQLNDIYIGYGLRSYPTYDKGWRYVKPFMLSGQNTDIEQLPYYFVRTKDLEAVAKEAIRSTKYLMKTVQNRGMSMENAIFIYTRFIDNIFYDKGVFCSPDLLRQVWRWKDTVLLCLSAGLLFIAWLLRRTLGSSKMSF
jgi:hypothetical protein